ncbi:MAG: DEAD/DEAH box helicase, partial [Methylococcales bacterium]|nr:DEAD/DEAH box helicase [Methylococcales bacterium]
MNLTDSIDKITRVGKAMVGKLKNLGIVTVEDLLFYWPFRYDDFSQTTPIGELTSMTRANIVGEIAMISNKRSFRRRLAITEALIMDDSGTARAVWFNQPFIVRNLKVGDRVSLSGKVEEEYGSPLMQSPVYEKIHTPAYGHPSPEGNKNIIHTQGLVPNYNLTANLTQKQLRFLVSQVIGLAKTLPDHLPPNIKKDYGLIDLGRAVEQIHFPKNQAEIDEAKQRLAFDELFLLQLRSQIIRRQLKHLNAPAVIFHQELTKRFVDGLPFVLTPDQKKSAWEIIQDLGRTVPMTRLLEGDVGSGKTIVALLAMINVASNKFQSALLVPTEILARQHFDSITKLLAKTNIKVGLITRSYKKSNIQYPTSNIQQARSAKQKKLTANEISQEADIIIGTHALIQETVKFKNLALVVVDEQHRFGVNQRQALIKQTHGANSAPHLLS